MASGHHATRSLSRRHSPDKPNRRPKPPAIVFLRGLDFWHGRCTVHGEHELRDIPYSTSYCRRRVPCRCGSRSGLRVRSSSPDIGSGVSGFRGFNARLQFAAGPELARPERRRARRGPDRGRSLRVLAQQRSPHPRFSRCNPRHAAVARGTPPAGASGTLLALAAALKRDFGPPANPFHTGQSWVVGLWWIRADPHKCFID